MLQAWVQLLSKRRKLTAQGAVQHIDVQSQVRRQLGHPGAPNGIINGKTFESGVV